MPENKNQHFVPKHYLRQFSVDGGKNIGVGRIDPFDFKIGPIKGQCKEEWFYRGDGQLDDWLRETESVLGDVLLKVIGSRSMSDEQLVACRYFSVLLYIRTRKAVELHGLFSRRVFFEVVNEGIRRGDVPPPPDNWSMETVRVKGVSGHLVKYTLLQCFFEMNTLNCKLLEPSKGKFFITSDHPVVCMNQLFANDHTQRSYVGFSRSGFQLVLPISPTLCIFFYDPKVYKVGNRRESIVCVTDKDLELLNSLQIQNADQCVYSSDENSQQQMQNLISRFAGFRKPVSESLQISQLDKDREFYHTRTPNPRVAGNWAFCKLQRTPRIPESKRRNSDWSQMIEDFTTHSSRVKPGDLVEEFKRFTENYGAA